MQVITLTLYGTSGCHLCDDARCEINKVLARMPTLEVTLSVVDIVDDDNLFELYQTSIPVLRIETVRRARILHWPFDQALVEVAIGEIS